MDNDDQYICSLDEKGKEKDRKELSERNDKDRDLAVASLREWAKEQVTWLKTPTDYNFLLRFLRVRKFSQLEARKSIENYWTFKTNHPEIAMDLDPSDPVIQEIFRAGIYFSSKRRDKDGCRVLVCNLGRISLNKVKSTWGKSSLYKAYILVNEWLMFDENVQVNGMKQIWEYTDLQFETVRHFMLNEHNQHIMKFLSKCMPARVKGLYTYNDPPYVDVILSLFAPFLSKKIRDRKCMPARVKGLYTYNDPPYVDVILSLFAPFLSKKIRDRLISTGRNLCKLYEYVDMSVLPDEYLPDDYTGPSSGSEKQIIEEMLDDMRSPAFQNHLRKICSTKYGVDLKRRENGVQEIASFRKLNID